MIFFIHPKHNSSRVHSIFFSIAGGFTNPLEFEYIIGHLPMANLASTLWVKLFNRAAAEPLAVVV